MAEIAIPELVTSTKTKASLVRYVAGLHVNTQADQLPCGACGLPVHKARSVKNALGPLCRIEYEGRLSCTQLYQDPSVQEAQKLLAEAKRTADPEVIAKVSSKLLKRSHFADLVERLQTRDDTWAEVQALWATMTK